MTDTADFRPAAAASWRIQNNVTLQLPIQSPSANFRVLVGVMADPANLGVTIDVQFASSSDSKKLKHGESYLTDNKGQITAVTATNPGPHDAAVFVAIVEQLKI